jgi:hypothetical protein
MRHLFLLSFIAGLAFAQDNPSLSSTVAGLKPRSIGPAMMSGRISSLAVHPENTGHYFVGVASGGLWKTLNNGATWTPVFDRQGSYSIGYVTLDPKNPNTVWVGTGEDNSQRSDGYGRTWASSKASTSAKFSSIPAIRKPSTSPPKAPYGAPAGTAASIRPPTAARLGRPS